MTAPYHVMAIAGSDSGGGAGIQADLKTFAAMGCYGSSVVTGLTAQNTMGVQGVHEVPTEFVLQQLRSVWADVPPRSVKLGMLTSASTITALAQHFADISDTRPTIILDPVMISTSGHNLIPPEAVEAIRSDLLPHVDWVTPNIPEAQALAGTELQVESLEGMLRMAMELASTYNVPKILLKGGHLTVRRDEVVALQQRGEYELAGRRRGVLVNWEDGDCVEVLQGYRRLTGIEESGLVVDMLVQHEEAIQLFVGSKIETSSTHGTGCTLSSALACAVIGESDAVACQRAIRYVRAAIAGAFPFGKGHGPLNHSILASPRALPPPSPFNPHPFTTHLIQSNLPLWHSYVKHPFVVAVGDGTLPRDSFEHYIKQDYHYLRHYARAHALGAFKSSSFADIEAFTDIAKHIARESQMHVAFCESFGITLEQLTATPESAACAAYARYILDVGAQGDVLDLYMAVASCLIGYGEVGLWLRREVDAGRAKLEGNPYRRWIEDYSGPEFIGAVNKGIENLEKRVAADPPGPEHLARLTAIWHECVRLERDFWEMGLLKL